MDRTARGARSRRATKPLRAVGDGAGHGRARASGPRCRGVSSTGRRKSGGRCSCSLSTLAVTGRLAQHKRRKCSPLAATGIDDKPGQLQLLTFDAFCELFLARHGATVSARTRDTSLSGSSRHGRCSAPSRSPGLRAQPPTSPAGALASRIRAATASRSRPSMPVRRSALGLPDPQPRWLTPVATPSRALRSYGRSRATRWTRWRRNSDRSYGPLVVFAAETGLRTNEWTRSNVATSIATDPPSSCSAVSRTAC